MPVHLLMHVLVHVQADRRVRDQLVTAAVDAGERHGMLRGLARFAVK